MNRLCSTHIPKPQSECNDEEKNINIPPNNQGTDNSYTAYHLSDWNIMTQQTYEFKKY
jgi:hypothetical protein